MKTYNRFTSVLSRVAVSLRESYEVSTGTDLIEENRKFVQSEQTLNRTAKLTLALMIPLLFLPWPLAVVIHWTGLIDGKFNEIFMAVILVVIVIFCFLAYFRKTSYEAAKVMIASGAILEKFEDSVRALEQMRYRLSEDRRPFTLEAIHENLVAMARDVRDAEGLEKYLFDTGKLDLVTDIVGLANRVKEMRQLLENALACQSLFGLRFTRRELFQEAEAKSK